MLMELLFKNTELETYEWDNVWFEQANQPDAKRVLYIGDSISCGTRHQATIAAGNKIFFDGIGTSKAVDNQYFKSKLISKEYLLRIKI